MNLWNLLFVKWPGLVKVIHLLLFLVVVLEKTGMAIGLLILKLFLGILGLHAALWSSGLFSYSRMSLIGIVVNLALGLDLLVGCMLLGLVEVIFWERIFVHPCQVLHLTLVFGMGN